MSKAVATTHMNRLPSRIRAARAGGLRVASGVRRIVRPIPYMQALRPPRIDRERLEPQVGRAVFGWGLINPLLSAPQLYNIFVIKHVAGLSVITISAALLMAALWTAYGILGRQTVVWVTSGVWVVLNSVTLVGVVLFG